MFDRLDVLRNQLVHGGATWNSQISRGATAPPSWPFYRVEVVGAFAAARSVLPAMRERGAGSVTWEITTEPFQAFNCHCKLCRKAHGSAFGTYWFMHPDEFRWTGPTDTIAQYRSSHLLTRSFCGTCGSVAPLARHHRRSAGVRGETGRGLGRPARGSTRDSRGASV